MNMFKSTEQLIRTATNAAYNKGRKDYHDEAQAALQDLEAYYRELRLSTCTEAVQRCRQRLTDLYEAKP